MLLNETILWQEIFQQPAVVETVLNEQQKRMHLLARAIQARGLRSVMIAARGTSDNAARYAKYVLGARNGLLVTLATPSLFSIYEKPPDLSCSLVLGISQSGASPDLVAVLTEARRQGALTAVFTNNLHSPLAKLGEHLIDLSADVERAVAATKTYTAELAAVALLSALLAGDSLNELYQLPKAMIETLLAQSSKPEGLMPPPQAVVGRGFNYCTAFEIALKVKELAYHPVHAYSSADFIHGPLAMVEEGFSMLIVAPSGRLDAELLAFTKRMKQLAVSVSMITDREALLTLADYPLRLPTPIPEWLSPLTAVLPGQLLAARLAASVGENVDAPRQIQKVTRTI